MGCFPGVVVDGLDHQLDHLLDLDTGEWNALEEARDALAGCRVPSR